MSTCLEQRRARYAGLLIVGLAAAWVGCRAAEESPPAHAALPAVVRAALSDSAFTWVEATTPHAHLHALAGSPAAADLARLGERVEASYAAVLDALHEPADPAADPFEMLFVEDRAQMEALIGRPSGGRQAAPRFRAKARSS